jgi:Rrf2 family iron-sulfur cluster assembly transcriptional regulator
LLALAYLALNRDRLVKVEEIAEAQSIPKPFLSKIFHKLVKERVLRSYKGPNGGFTFMIPPEKITIYDIRCDKVFGRGLSFRLLCPKTGKM